MKKEDIAYDVKEYLSSFFEEEKRRILSMLCMCEPDINKLLEIKAYAKAIVDLEKKILLDLNSGR